MRLTRLRNGLYACVWLLVSGACLAQSSGGAGTNTPEDEYRQLIKVDTDIQPLGANPFGESISLYNGTLSFEQTDISLKGDGPTIALLRSLSTTDSPSFGLNVQRPFGDWDMDIPRIETAVANSSVPQAIWQVPTSTPLARCSQFQPPPIVNATQPGAAPWAPSEYWYGYHMIIPGQGSQDLLERTSTNTLTPTISGQSFPIVTKQNWMIRCGVASDDGGEGFVALAPDGTQYTFTHLVYRPMAGLTKGLTQVPGALVQQRVTPDVSPSSLLDRRDALMLVTLVTDRFGNTLSYSYDSQGRLSGVSASDGRVLTLQYGASTSPLVSSASLTSASAGTRTWTYSYAGVGTTQPTLTGVQLPDGSAWGFNLNAFQNAPIQTENLNCSTSNLGTFGGNAAVGTITHPSGLVGTFTTQPMMRGRSYVFHQCFGPIGNAVFSEFPEVYFQQTITSKVFTGAGIPTETWNYSYSSANPSWTTDACASTNSCASTVFTDVVDPDGRDARYTFSNRFDISEGQLLRTDYYSGSNTTAVLRSEINTYANPTGGPWPTSYGIDGTSRDNLAQVQELSPLSAHQVVEEGDTYTWQVEGFNAFAQLTQAHRSNSIAGQGSIDESTSYLNDTNLWVLGLPTQVVNNTDSQVESSNTYTSQDELATRTRFGQQLMSYEYDTQGHLTSFTDGDSHTTVLSNYKRGIPQNIAYPDGKSASLVVDDFAQIDSFTDQRSATTSYQYDAAGRVTQVSHNSFSGDPTWLPQTYTYTFVTFAEEGLPAGHWRRSIGQGNAIKVDWFDALMRPVLTDTGIMGPNGGINISRVTGYDWHGKVTFASTPVNGIPDLTTITTGVHTQYDALERVVQTQQDSELGTLTTATAYLAGAGRQVTDPKGNVTTSHYQVFDEPAYDAVTQVQAPEGVTQSIARDRYGKPTAITQSGSYSGQTLSVSKTLVYDANQRLCRFTDPETNSTVYSYDGANNIAWQATGQVISGTGCGQEQIADAVKTFHTYDPMNRVLTITPPAGTQSTAYTYDAVGELLDAQSGSNHWFTSYDSLGHEQGEAFQVDGQAAASGVSYTYDTYGHVLTMSYFPGGGVAPEVVNYAPDALGRPVQAGSYATNIAYQPDGSLAGYTLGNGIRVTQSQNTRLLLSGKSAIGASNTALNELYAYDANGNLTSVNDIGGNNNSQTEGYDGLNRLTSGNAPGPWGPQTYAYDPLNNLRENVNNGTLVDYALDGTSHMTSETVNGSLFQTFGYDARGNRTSEITRGVPTTYNFDALNQLLSIPGKASYLYDDLGRRVAKTLASGPTSYFFYTRTNGHLLQQSDSFSGQATNYIYLNNELIARHQASTVTYTITDRLGTPIVESNASGATTVRFAYDPYGGRRQGVNQQQPGFTGHVNDPENGLTYMQARYYDPNGHMTSPDPVYPAPGDLFGFNRYVYAENNPVMRTDPDGRQSAMDAGFWATEAVMSQQSPQQVQRLNEQNVEQIKVVAVSMAAMAGTPAASFVARTAAAVVTDSLAAGSLATGLMANGPSVVASGAIVTEAVAAANGTPAPSEAAFTAVSLEARGTTFSANQIKADMTQGQAIENLASNGYAKAVSQSGTVTVMSKGENVYTFYPSSTGNGMVGSETGIPSASLTVGGAKKPITKIRFNDEVK